jgi:hypothetical protein
LPLSASASRKLRGKAFETGFVIKKYVELATLPGWTAVDDVRQFAFLGRTLGSPLFTADVGRLEINDGGSSTLPDQLDPLRFYWAVAASRS